MAAYQVGFLGTPAGRDDTLRSTLKSRLSEIGIDFDAVTVLAEADIASRNRKNPFVGIFFGYPAADDGAHPALPALIADSVVVVPCVDDLGRFTGHTPPALRHINGFELSPSDPGLEKLCALVLENFRLLRPERRLFISYRRNESQGIAIQLYERLDELGFDGFLDTRDVPPGKDFQSVLWHRLADSDVVVLLDTPGFRASRWTHEELARANATSIQILGMSRALLNSAG